MRWFVAQMAMLGALMLPLPAFAAEPAYQPPQGCVLDMTVQLHDCHLANHFHCADDPVGDRWVSYTDGGGEYFLSHIDRETRWIESISLQDGVIDRLDESGSADHASFSTLLATGRDDFDFITTSSNGEPRRYIGFDQLTGTTVKVGKVVLERSTFQLRIEDGSGNFIALRKGNQLIDRDMRVFFSDAETFENAAGDTASTFEAPAAFAFPGEAGFGATKPEFDCDMMMTHLLPIDIKPTL
ncbi:MAG TPA: hypothetical protein VGC40_03430 [Paenirhodobacter sp.]